MGGIQCISGVMLSSGDSGSCVNTGLCKLQNAMKRRIKRKKMSCDPGLLTAQCILLRKRKEQVRALEC